ncbi:manganese/zinc/iron transport system substrate-binding protein [Halolactibacillus halophilus]|uniref:Manganese transporter n=1 Tax=Halolactibacillus halophilus TaxID=306540 RepID=A0A1I5NNJ5_9BACI|nr:zinc ABC transporter substrate-binding protein [Halolactibacillus halophilus]GEM01402.1 manganese transporter [Halolactibacillus halophilus]SFP23373.1 manganese/zinc/iron transport system substrate-binding protein [Halolactibacillus halophilus]
MKIKINHVFITVVLGLLLLLSACGDDNTSNSSDAENGEINIVTTISQIGEPLSVIGGDKVVVTSLMGPSVDPHLYNPTQSDITKVDQADVVFYSGLNLEANMVDVFEAISDEKVVLAVGDSISEDDLLYDEEGAIDPHIWFDIDLWEQALTSAVDKLKEYSPEDAEFFENNKNQYFEKLADLKESAEKITTIPDEQRILVTAHDAFGYFGRKYDMDVIGLQGLSTEDEVGVSDINDTIAVIKDYNVPAIFVESSINQDTIQAVIEGAQSDGVDVALGGELFSDAMGEANTEKGTYIGMYEHNIETIYNALNK